MKTLLVNGSPHANGCTATALGVVAKELEKNGIEAEELIVEGAPVKSIVSVSGDYDVIVMGTLGRTGFAKLMMGSVAERVVRASSCPVLVVRANEAGN